MDPGMFFGMPRLLWRNLCTYQAQATTAGIQAAKGLLSKKIKLVKVTVKAGYRVLLKDGNKHEN